MALPPDIRWISPSHAVQMICDATGETTGESDAILGALIDGDVVGRREGEEKDRTSWRRYPKAGEIQSDDKIDIDRHTVLSFLQPVNEKRHRGAPPTHDLDGMWVQVVLMAMRGELPTDSKADLRKKLEPWFVDTAGVVPSFRWFDEHFGRLIKELDRKQRSK